MTYIHCLIFAVVTVIFVYTLSRIQAIAWLHTLEKFLNNKHNNILKTEENEQEQSKNN
jgi:hypothetical protein